MTTAADTQAVAPVDPASAQQLASVIRRAALIGPLGPNSTAVHAAGGKVMLTPSEAEAAAAAVLRSSWLKAYADQQVQAALDQTSAGGQA